jgi:hypothetical protein
VQSPQTAPGELLSALSGALSELGAQWYLFGAQAAVGWGVPSRRGRRSRSQAMAMARMTHDIDHGH